MTVWRRSGAIGAAVVLAACSGGTPSGGDADAEDQVDEAGAGDDAGELEIAPPEPPDIPWLDAGTPPVEAPRLTPCPPGWRELADPETGTVTCDPWPETGHEDCAAVDEAHFPGEPGCTRVGTACSPDDDWATDLPAGAPILYVLAGAAPGGDGTRAAPFATIGAALARAAAGTIVAVGKGTYDEVVSVPGGVTLWGACVAETVIASSVPSESAATVAVGSRAVVLRNLRVGGERWGVMVMGGRRSAELRDVVVAGTLVLGLYVDEGAQLTAERVVVRDTRSEASDGRYGLGLQAAAGASVRVTRGVFERNRDIAVAVFDAGTTVALEDVAIRETRGREADRYFGRAVQVVDGASLAVRRGVFERNHETAVMVSHAGTTVTLEDVVVRDIRSRETDRPAEREAGRGLQVNRGASVQVRRAVFERNRDCGVAVLHAGTTARLEDVVVRDTAGQESDGAGGRGLEASDGASVEVTRGVFERNHDIAVTAFDVDTAVALRDVAIRDTRSQESDGVGGRGLQASDGASVEVTRGVFERNRDNGLLAAHVGTTVILEDVAIRDTRSRDTDRNFGRGLNVQDGAAVQVRRAAFERNLDAAVAAFDPGTLVILEDVALRDTGSRESDRTFGVGLHVQGGASAEVMRGMFERNHDITICATNAGTSVTLQDLVVRDTLGAECGLDAPPCPGTGGLGVASYGGAGLAATRFLVTRSALCGIQVAHGLDAFGVPHPEGGTMDLHEGEISFNTVCGANVQTEGFDYRRLMDRILFRGNPTNLDATALPVPGVTLPAAEP